jgi:hypothetical protein
MNDERDREQDPEERPHEEDSDYGSDVNRKPLDGEPIAKTSSGDADSITEH